MLSTHASLGRSVDRRMFNGFPTEFQVRRAYLRSRPELTSDAIDRRECTWRNQTEWQIRREVEAAVWRRFPDGLR